MMYEVFTYGSGQMVSDILNGVALVMGDSQYDSFMRIGISFAFGALLIMTAFDLKLARVAKWYAMVMTVYTALIVPKADVLITDPVLRNAQYEVSNVPLGLAFIVSVLTSIEYNLTTALETALHVPDDISYNQTGMMMASDMVRKSSSYKIQDPDFASNIRSYIQQCIQYDLLHGKYTVRELFNSDNIWKFTTQNASQARAFLYDGKIVTCAVGATTLGNDWDNEIKTSKLTFAARLFGDKQDTTADEQLSRYLQTGYRHLANISSSASEIMQQTMLVNAFHDGVISNAGELGAAAAVESYAVARATQNSRSAYKISGEVAARFLPYIKNTLQLLLIGAFIVIVPMFFLISGVSRIRNYVEILASLSLWGPMYAILNMQMTGVSRWKIIGLASQPSINKTAITIANLPGIEQIAADQVILAGYLALSIPLISYGLIKGSMYSFTSLASGIIGVAQSSSGHAAEEATTGNYSLGNLSMENTNAYNTSSFHDDSSVRISSGSTMVEDMNGTMNTLFNNGDMKTDQRSALSSLASSVNFGSRLESSLSRSYNDSISSAQSSSVDLSHTLASAYHDTYELAKGVDNNISSDASRSMGYSSSEVQALNDYKTTVDTIMEQNGISENEAFTMMANAKVSGGIPLIRLGGEMGVSATNDASINHQESSSQSISTGGGVSNTIDTAMRVASDSSHRTSENESTRLSDSVRTNLDEAQTLRESISSNLQQAEGYQKALSHVQNNSASISTSGDQLVYDELRKTVNPDTGRSYTNNDLSELGKAGKLDERIQPIVEKHASEIVSKVAQIDDKADGIKSAYEGNSRSINEKGGQITHNHADNKIKIAQEDNLRRVEKGLDSKIDAKLTDNADKITTASTPIAEKEKEMRKGIEDEREKSLAIKATSAGLNRAKETFKDLKNFAVDKMTSKEE